jgi:hypothetical protein
MPVLSQKEFYDLRWGFAYGAAAAVTIFITVLLCGLFGVFS